MSFAISKRQKKYYLKSYRIHQWEHENPDHVDSEENLEIQTEEPLVVDSLHASSNHQPVNRIL